jgi:hypothetical protein
MNKATIFAAAHKIAKKAIQNGKFNNNYRGALSWALKTIRGEARVKAAVAAAPQNDAAVVFAAIMGGWKLDSSWCSSSVAKAKEALKKDLSFRAYNNQGEVVSTSRREVRNMQGPLLLVGSMVIEFKKA